MGEFVVGGQVVRAHMKIGHMRMAAEIQGWQGGAGLTAQQESYGGGARGVALQGFLHSTPKSGRSILFQQTEQLRSLRAGRFPISKRQVEQLPAFRNGVLQTPARGGVKSFALEFEHRLLMSRIENELMPVIRAGMAGQFRRAIENAHGGVAGHQGKGAADGARGDRVIVEIEANVDGLARWDGHDAIGGKRMLGGRHKPRLLFLEGRSRQSQAWRLHSASVVKTRPAQNESRTERMARSTRPF